jgi:hypothetical protein
MLPITKFIAAIGSFLAMIALMPAELQKEIPQLFPEAQRGRIGIALALLAFVARYITARQGTTPPNTKNENPPR